MANSKKISLNLDSDLWHKFRIRTVQEHKTATQVLEDFIREYLKNKK